MTSVPIMQIIPTTSDAREQVGRLARELRLARRLLTLAKLADECRDRERAQANQAVPASR